MATSVKIIPVICALALLVGVKHAMTAETARPNIPHLAPGKVQETIAPAATVVSTVHYQAYAGLSCFTSLCLFSFPKPGRKHRLNLKGLACDLHGDTVRRSIKGSFSYATQLTMSFSANTCR